MSRRLSYFLQRIYRGFLRKRRSGGPPGILMLRLFKGASASAEGNSFNYAFNSLYRAYRLNSTALSISSRNKLSFHRIKFRYRNLIIIFFTIFFLFNSSIFSKNPDNSIIIGTLLSITKVDLNHTVENLFNQQID